MLYLFVAVENFWPNRFETKLGTVLPAPLAVDGQKVFTKSCRAFLNSLDADEETVTIYSL